MEAASYDAEEDCLGRGIHDWFHARRKIPNSGKREAN